MKVLLPCDIVDHLLDHLKTDQSEGFVRRFRHQSLKLIKWRLKSAGLAASEYLLLAFAVLFTLFEYQNKLVCLEQMAKLLVQKLLPLLVAEMLNLDFDSLFEKTYFPKQK